MDVLIFLAIGNSGVSQVIYQPSHSAFAIYLNCIERWQARMRELSVPVRCPAQGLW